MRLSEHKFILSAIGSLKLTIAGYVNNSHADQWPSVHYYAENLSTKPKKKRFKYLICSLEHWGNGHSQIHVLACDRISFVFSVRFCPAPLPAQSQRLFLLSQFILPHFVWLWPAKVQLNRQLQLRWLEWSFITNIASFGCLILKLPLIYHLMLSALCTAMTLSKIERHRQIWTDYEFQMILSMAWNRIRRARSF